MGAFGDWAQNYYDSGFSVLPVHPQKKACFIKGWSEKFSHRFPTEKEQQKYIEKYSDHDLGLACGQASGIVAVDFDYDKMADAQIIEQLVIGALPVSPVIKKGQKGWTRFYRFDGDMKNYGIDRFGVRMVDILSTGRLTVMPPSPHKVDGIVYRWLTPDDLLSVDTDDLPLLTYRHIRQLIEVAEYDNSVFKEVLKKKARHDAVVGFILRFSDQAKDHDELIQATIQADIELHKNEKKGPYLSDKNYLKEQNTYEYTRDLCERVIDWKQRKRASQGIDWDVGKYPKLQAEGKKQSTNYDDFKSFFEFNYPAVRFDKIRRTAFYYSQRLEKWVPIDNIREVIESKAHDAGLSPTYVNRHLQRWVGTLEPKLCIDVPRWKGQDLVHEMVTRLKITNIDQGLAVELFKEWGANVFRRLHDTKNREQNTMIILKGGQGIGKDSWIQHCFRGFRSYFSEIEIQDRKIENYQTISDLLIANIPEFDETHKVAISMIKTMITSPGATFRAAYARKSEYVPFYVSYISSCNFDYILRDSSGNRRFMIFDVESIDWGYDDIDPDQILAQFYHLYQLNFKASNKARTEIKKIISQSTPDPLDDLIAEECNAAIENVVRMRPEKLCSWREISDEIVKISRKYSVSLRRVQSIIKSNGMQNHRRDGRWYTPLS